VASVGIYNTGYLLGSILIFFPKAIGGALPQLLSKAIDLNNKSKAEQMMDYAIKIFLFVAIPFLIGSIILSKEVMGVIFDVELAKNISIIIPIITISMTFHSLNLILSNSLFVMKKTNAIFKVNFFGALINLFLNLILISLFPSILLPAFTTLFSYLISFIYMKQVVKQVWSVNFHVKDIFKSIFASCLMGIVIYFLKNIQNNIYELLLVIITGVIVYLFFMVMVKAFSKNEINFIKSLVKYD
jgi:O-antigen/teichoic acid export membrane protein